MEVSGNLYNKETNNVKSKLCSSYAWDSALKFIEVTNISYPTNSTGGNYRVATGGTGELQNTGYHVVNNIYDMGGNVYEWTTETGSEANFPCVGRGGDFGDSAMITPGAYLGINSPTEAFSNIGFRVTLFM